MSIKTLAGNAAWSMLAHLMGRGSLVVAAMILSNKLVTNEFATYSYFQLTVSMLATYAALGMGVTASRFFAEVDSVSDDKLQPLGALWLLSVVIGIIGSLVILLISDTLISGDLGIPNWLFSLGVFVILIGIVPNGAILGLEQYKKAAFYSFLSAAILIFGVLSLPKGNVGYDAILLFIISRAVQSFGSSLVVLNKVGIKRILKTLIINKTSIISIFVFAGPMLLVSLMAASGSWLVGRIILSGDSGEYEFALYSIGLQWFSLILFIPSMVSRVILPRLVRSNILNVKSKGTSLTVQALFLAAGSAVFTVMIGSLLSPMILEFYGESYRVSAWFLIVFMIAAIPASPANTFGNAIIAKDGQWNWLLIISFWLASLIIMSLLIVDFGALKSAYAFAISYAFLTVLAFIVAKKMRLFY